MNVTQELATQSGLRRWIQASFRRRTLVILFPPGLPACRYHRDAVKRLPSRRWWLRVAVLLAILAGGAGGYYYWWQHLRSALPAGIVYGNGRIEADEIDIDTKYAGRIAEMLADEGDLVKAGQVVARMDTQDLAASLKKAEAQVSQARRAVDEANANVTQQQTQVLLAQQEFDRAATLVQKGFQTAGGSGSARSNNWTAPTRRLARQTCG